jgi:hypothetical protein
MASKKEKLVLTDLRNVNHGNGSAFRVKKMVNTIDYKIGDYISTDEVTELLARKVTLSQPKDITIEIVPNK